MFSSALKVVSSEKVGWSGVASTLGMLNGDVVMDILLSLVEAAILYETFNIPRNKSADYFLVICSQRRLVCADVYTAQTSRRYQNRKCTAPFAVWNSLCYELVARTSPCCIHSAQTIRTVTHSKRRIVGAANVGSTD